MTDVLESPIGEPAATANVVAARREVIDQSGWGARVKIIQPRNLTFWVMILLFIGGITLTIRGYAVNANAYTGSFTLGTAWFAVYALAFMALFQRLDRFSSIPGKAKLLAFAFGGLVTTFGVAAINNDAFRGIILKLGGSDFFQNWSAGLTAPWSEEIAKMMPLILLIGIAPGIIRHAFDGLIVGAISGLAFQVFENVSYVYGSAASNFGQDKYGITTMVTRTFLGAVGHWAWAGVAGAGLIYLIGRPAERPRRALGLMLIASSMIIHGLWDSLGGLTGWASWTIGLYFPLSLIGLVIFIWVYRHTVVHERAWARELLADEVRLGVISDDELEAAIGTRKQRKHFVRAQSHHRPAKHVLEGIMDLADAIAASDGIDSPSVDRARSEIERLRGAAPAPA